MAMGQADPRTIPVVGPATIYEVSAIRETLRQALSEGEDFQIDLRDTGKWDLAGLQLLISCVRTAEVQGGKVQLRNVPRSCADIAERSGLEGWLRTASQ
jgi:ABC-type transporter Mla MlaB component